MASAFATLGVVLCMSLLEGTWSWLLAAAASEVVGQQHPSLTAVGLVLFGGWFGTRTLALTHLPLERRRWLLIAGGLATAATFGTIQAGLVLPVQLVFGQYTPDYRGAGVMLFFLTAYLWGRGLALAVRVNRERVINHIGVSASGLVGVLVFLPLVDAVQRLGFGVVVASFLFAVTGLLLVQLAGVKSYQLSRSQWAVVAAGTAILLVLGGSLLTGAASSGALGVLGRTVASLSRTASPLTDAILLALGHLAEYVALFLRWLSQLFGLDAETISRAMQAAEETRPQFEESSPSGPPEALTLLVTLLVTFFLLAIVVSVFYRLVYAASDGDDTVREIRASARAAPGRRASALRRALDRLLQLGREGEAVHRLDSREAIRRYYRTFQTLMARAGFPRRASDTPREYQQALRAAIPPSALDVAQITDAYVVARYGQPGARLPDPATVGQAVVRVRDALRTHESG